MELKNTLKKHRQDKGLTQEELASMLGVSRQTIISIERYCDCSNDYYKKYAPTTDLLICFSFLRTR